MKEQTAIKHLRYYMLALQRTRGIVREQMADIPERMLADVWPWVHGEKCPLPLLVKILDRIDEGNSLIPLDYYNMMVVLCRFMPEVKVMVDIYLGQNHEPIIPDDWPTPDILRGWD